MPFLDYLPELFTWWNMTMLIGGTVGGLLLGAAPGLSPTMSVALLIPFTFAMDPAAGLILLGAVYTATVAGGAVSAILVNIPGAPANIATLFDGNAMARQGRATEALHYCFIASGIGGIFGVLLLMFFTPMLAEFALRFGPSELFWMAVLGITVIGSLGAKSTLRGLFAGAFGVWLSTIGYDPVLGVPRFVLFPDMAGGINIIAALIGLFAIPEVLALLSRARARDQITTYEMSQHSVWTSLRGCVKRIRALTIGTIVGSFVGLIPGAGGQIAGLVAYDQTRRFSPYRDRFGQGEPAGVIAAESANNAMVGPSLVPLLTLSIPGSPTAAVLLGGLLIHGLFPGPDLFTKHAEVTWVFIDSLLLAQVVMVIAGLYLSRFSYYITRIPAEYMAAGVMVLAVFGTYSVQNSFPDVLWMMGLGVAMYFFDKAGFSAAPLVLGIILGPIAETNFVQGQMVSMSSGGTLPYFFTGTLNLIMIGLCVVSVAYSLFGEIKPKNQPQQEVMNESQ
ncbi:tripartite tricarboxylate transporter permease [Salinisphaera aquimarina]